MNTTLAKNIVTARELRGLDQVALAKLSHVSQATISDIERGRNSTSMARQAGVSKKEFYRSSPEGSIHAK